MAVFTGNTIMHYCPKCRRTYEDGIQRFCSEDGGRLLPAPSGKKPNAPTGGVFTNLLGKMSQSERTDNKLASAPRFIAPKPTAKEDKPSGSFPLSGKIFKTVQDLKSKFEPSPEDEEVVLEIGGDLVPEIETKEPPPPVETAPQKPLPRIVRPHEIPSGTASIGDRRTNPAGRQAVSWENPEALLGQTVKGRYQVLEIIEEDEDSIVYLASDKIIADKKAVVRVFIRDREADQMDFAERIFAEERVSLSHLNHPNIAGVFDSGELPEGNEFIVSEFVEGQTLAETLRENGQFNVLRTARIIRQTSYALSEAHENGILHRNLKPENIVLTVSEAGIEQVKLMNFGLSQADVTGENLDFKAPEEIDGGISTFASDIFSLAVIAYQMLTARLPFTAETENGLLKAQRAGLQLVPTNLRTDVQPLADKILEKALSFNPSERYPKARDFGDAFFNALTTVSPWALSEENSDDEVELIVEEERKPREFIVIPALNPKKPAPEEAPIDSDIHISASQPETEEAEPAEVEAAEDLAWEKRSPEPPKRAGWVWGLLPVLGVLVLLAALWAGWNYFFNRPPALPEVAPPAPENSATDNNSAAANTEQNPSPAPSEVDMPPVARQVEQPAETERFQNTRENLSEDLAKNFLGFSLFYPNDWKKAESPKNYLDISKPSASGLPIEQMLVTRYESRGTFTLDKPNFPKLVEKSNEDLKKNLEGDFQVLWEGESSIQGGRWKVHEVKFQNTWTNEKGEKVTVWGRRMWLPVQIPSKPNGFVITMLATSLSPDVKSVDDVGTAGQLKTILETFEPEGN